MRDKVWRVRRYVVDVPVSSVIVPPPQLSLHPTMTKNVRVWGIWPPSWPLDGQPLLVFPVWHQAVSAAWSRAQFQNSPPPPNHVGSQGFREEA